MIELDLAALKKIEQLATRARLPVDLPYNRAQQIMTLYGLTKYLEEFNIEQNFILKEDELIQKGSGQDDNSDRSNRRSGRGRQLSFRFDDRDDY